MGGLLSFLSPALTTATNAASSYQGAQAGVAKQQHDDAIQQALLQAKMLKEKHDQESMDAFRRSQIGLNNDRANALRNPKPATKWYIGRDGEMKFLEAEPSKIGEAPPPVAPQSTGDDTPSYAGPPDLNAGSLAESQSGQQPPRRRVSVTGTGVFGPVPKPPTEPLDVRQEKRITDYRTAHPGISVGAARDSVRAATGMAPPVAPGNVYMTGADSTGKPTIFAGDTKGPPKLTNMNVAKPTPAASGANIARTASVRSGIAQMVNAHDALVSFEHALRAGTADISGLDQFLKQTSVAFSHSNPASNALMAGSLAWLAHKNPELARYVRRGLEFAQGESQVTGRPSDFRVKLSDFLATAQTGNYLEHPEMLDDIANTREATLAPLREYLGQPAAASGRGGGGTQTAATQDQKDWDAAVAKYGKERVLKEYGPRP